MMHLLHRISLRSASPFEGEVGPQVRVGGTVAALSLSTRRLNRTPHPALCADLPLKGGGEYAEGLAQ
jgi:hypothetical protein